MNGLNKTVLVTGSSRGLGEVIARSLVAKGHRVIINYYKSQELADKLVAELGEKNALAIKADVRDFEEVKAMIQQGTNYFGQIDAVVNNALVNFKFDPVAQKSFGDLSL